MMIRGILLSLSAVCLVQPPVSHAQDRPQIPAALTLADAVDLARNYNPLLRQTANDLTGTRWGVRNAYASFVPSVSLDGSMGYSGAGSQTFLTSQFVQQSSTIGSSYGVNLSLQLSGRSLMQPAVANAQHRAAEARLSGEEVSLESNIRGQYLLVLEAEAQVQLAELQVTRNEEFLRLAQARFDVGQNTQLDVRQAEVALGQSEVLFLRNEQSVIVEKLRLFQLMGLPAPDDPNQVTLTDTFPITEPAWQLSDLLGEAEQANPDLIALRAQSSAASTSERAAKSTWLPTLSFNAGWSGYTQQYRDIDPLITNARASADGQLAECNFINNSLVNPGESGLDCSGISFTPEDEARIRADNDVFPFDFTSQPFSARVTISLPIFTQFSRPLEIAEASARADDAREAVRGAELQVRTNVSQAYYGLRAAYEAIGIQENNQVAAAEQLRLATERYRVGSGTFFELLDAQLAAQQAEADYINAIYAYHRAIATLENAVGRPLR
jgi:outer membrane protein TolC